LSSFNKLMFGILAVAGISLAGIGRHNEQGLSPTHSYKRSGGIGVVSNLNGNLVVTSGISMFLNPTSVSVARNWNSHWRDPLIVHQYDMDYSTYDYGSKGSPTYDDHDISDLTPRSIGGFATRRVQRYNNPSATPFNAEFAKNMSLSILNQAVALKIQMIVQQKYASTLAAVRFRQDHPESVVKFTDQQKLDIQQMEQIQAAVSIFGGALTAYMNGGADFAAIGRCYSGNDKASDDCIRSNLNVLSSFGGNYYLDKGLTTLSGETVNIPILTIASMVYDVSQGKTEDAAWEAGTLAAEAIVNAAASSAATSTAAAGAAGAAASASWAGPVGIAVAVAIQLTRMAIAKIQADDKSFDVGWVEINPWAMGISGYLGMLGTNHDPQRSGVNARFNRKWKTSSVDNSSKDSSKKSAARIIYTDHQESRHPMADMQLVGADGGASRFILTDDSIQTDNHGRRWVAYSSLSNADRRKVYYCLPDGGDASNVIDLGLNPTKSQIDNSRNMDTSGYYLVKDGDGNQVYFRTKGIDLDFAGTSTYWSVPTGSRNGIGDSIAALRDGNLNVIAAWDVRTNRGILIDRSSPVTLRQGSSGSSPSIGLVLLAGANPMIPLSDEKSVLPLSSWDETVFSGILNVGGGVASLASGVDTVWSHFEEQDYEGFYGAKDQAHMETYPTLAWEVRRGGQNADNTGRRDTTKYSYANGDLIGISSPEGSRTYYSYAGARRDPRDGFVLESREYPDPKTAGFYKQTIYNYVGWDDARPQLLRTNVTTRLSQPDYTSTTPSTRLVDIADSYTFGAMRYGMNINRSLAGYSARTTVYLNDSLKDTTKVLDSLEYSSVRYQLLSETHGAGSAGQNRIVTVWNGDQKLLQIESKGLSRVLDPRVTVWQYDRDGNMIQERSCPKNIIDSIAAKLQGTDTGWKYCTEVRTDLTQRKNDVGEYWKVNSDTLTIKGNKIYSDNSRLNLSFSPEHAYQVALPTSKKIYRVLGNDSVLIGDSTVYDSTKYGWLRNSSSLSWLGGKWVETQRNGYHSARPTVLTHSWRALGGDSASYSETDYDGDITFLVASRTFVSATKMGSAGSGPSLETKYGNDELGRVIHVTDAGGHTTDSLRDARGRVVKVIRPDKSESTTLYGDRLTTWQGSSTGYPWLRSLFVQETDPSGVQSEARFDGLGRMLGVVKRPNAGRDSQVVLTSYNIFDKLQWKRDGDNREEFHDYDLSGRLAVSRVYKTRGDNSGAALSWEKRYGWNDSAKTLTETDELGTQTIFHWDSHGRDTLIERDSSKFASGWDKDGGLGKIQVHQSYDNVGNLVKLVDPKGLVETRSYDERNRLTKTVYPDDLRHAVGYDLAGRIIQDTVSHNDGSEPVIKNIGYDAADRLVQESYGSGARENVSYSWGTSGADKGRLLGVTRGTGLSASYGYDDLGRRTTRSLTLAGIYSASQGWSCDVTGAPVKASLPGGGAFTNGYDSYHRLNRMSFGWGTATNLTDSVNLLHDASYLGNDLMTGYGLGKNLKTSYRYESVRAVLTENLVTRQGATTDTLYRQGMKWDDAGNVVGMHRGIGDSLGFGMDRLYQLRSVDYGDGQHLSTDYDPNGNRVRHDHPMGFGVTDSFSYTGNRVNAGRTARKGVTMYRHDAQGNLSLEADFVSSDTSDLTKAWRVIDRKWNKRSELERARIITRLDGTDTTQLRYEYGEDGNRVASLLATSITGTDTTWQVTHRWVYDGTSIVADSGSDHGWMWHGFQGLSRVAEITDTALNKPRVRYVLVDHQGSTQKLLDDTGAVLGQWVWDPWGNLEYARTDASTDLLYQGKTLEPKLGDWYFNARWYNPERGSFTGRDPKEQFYSPYCYSGNEPISGIDPTGLDWDYATMDAKELDVHMDFALHASPEEWEIYTRISDDHDVLVSHHVDPTMATDAAARNVGAKNSFGQKLISIDFRDASTITSDRLLHESVHVGQMMDNTNFFLPNGKKNVRVEVPAWDAQVKYMDRNKIPMDEGKKFYELHERMWNEDQKALHLLKNGYNKYGYDY